MSRAFKSKFDQLKENDPTGENTEADIEAEYQYPTEGNVRNLCFVQPDGIRIFLNYAYLVSGEYRPETGLIILEFTTHTIKLSGTNMEELYEDIMSNKMKKIVVMNERYKYMSAQLKHSVQTISITGH